MEFSFGIFNAPYLKQLGNCKFFVIILPSSSSSLLLIICSSRNLASRSCIISHNTVPIALSELWEGVINDHLVPLNSSTSLSWDLPPPVRHCCKLTIGWHLAGVNVLLSNSTILSKHMPNRRVARRLVFPLNSSFTWNILQPKAGSRLQVWM